MARAPNVGNPAPDFKLPSTQGEITLSQRLRLGPVLLVFYTGDDTPVCTKQWCNYRDNPEAFDGLGVQVLGINPQSEKSHEAFAAKHHLPFPLLSDTKGRVCKRYGALNFVGMAKRALVLVGRDGTVKWRRSDLPIFHRSAEEVRAAIAGLEL